MHVHVCVWLDWHEVRWSQKCSMEFCTTCTARWLPLACCWEMGSRNRDGKSVITFAHQDEEAGLMRTGLSLQGHLNWPPFCVVMLNVTHLTRQVIIDRFNRKVSALKSQPPRQSSSQWKGRASRGRSGEGLSERKIMQN